MTNSKARSSQPLTRAEIGALADSLRSLLADPDAALARARRAHLEGALTALEIVLGRAPSLVAPEIGDEIRALL